MPPPVPGGKSSSKSLPFSAFYFESVHPLAVPPISGQSTLPRASFVRHPLPGISLPCPPCKAKWSGKGVCEEPCLLPAPTAPSPLPPASLLLLSSSPQPPLVCV